jgi:hypothetical protein
MQINCRKTTTRRRKGLAAFSLAEVTVGLGIMGATFAALLTGFGTGMFTIQMARENLRATQIMLEKMETIRLYSWDQINSNGFILPTFTAKYDPQAAADQQGLVYSGTMTIANAPISSSYAGNMKLVTVTLNWKTGNVNRNRQFKSYISRYGMQDYIY